MVLKLCRLVSDCGCAAVKNTVFSTMCSFPEVHRSLSTLLHGGADPTAYLHLPIHRGQMPLETGITLVIASTHPALLAKIEQETSYNLKMATNYSNWPVYKSLLCYLTLSGHQLRPQILDYLYCNHAHMYLYVYHYHTQPKPLAHQCRRFIRSRLKPNAIVGVKYLDILPATTQRYLLFGAEDFLLQ